MTDKKTTTPPEEVLDGYRAADADLTNATARLTAYEDAVMEDAELADAVANLQDCRARLGLVERTLTVELGKRLGKTTGSLSDGRMFTLGRSSDRKEWDHDDWKRDARRKIVEMAAAGAEGPRVVIDPATGEEVSLASVLHSAIDAAQAIHGAQAPKSTELKRLGLYASDYCTSTPSGWRFTAVKPHNSETTEDTTDA